MKEDRLLQWFTDLEGQLADPDLTAALSNEGYVDRDLWIGWATSCENLLSDVYGRRSKFLERFLEVIEYCYDEPKAHYVLQLHALFRSAKNEYINGYNDINMQITGVVLGNFTALTKEALSAGHDHVAAVLGSAALEDTLKRYAMSKGISSADAAMTEVINALKAKRLLPSGTLRALQPMPKLRNLALHANWDKLSSVEIVSLIAFVEAFLIKHFHAADQ